MTEAAAEASSEDVAEKDEEKEKETERPVNFFLNKSLGRQQCQNLWRHCLNLRAEETNAEEQQRKGCSATTEAFFRRRAAMP